jgi:hypothetical protein
MKTKLRRLTATITLVLFMFTLSMYSQDNHENLFTNLKMPSYSYKNLQIFLLSSNDKQINKDYVVLSKAMEKGYVVIKETGNVQELTVKNNSDKYIIINSGDIVKGGKQDRTVQYDIIVPPHSKEIPVASFCVESGRWQKRGDEAVNSFASNSKIVSSKSLRLAVIHDKEQGKVWSNVAEQQQKINTNVSEIKGKEVDVKHKASASSLQLTLENEDLDDLIRAYKKEFANIIDKNTESVGFAYAINGKLYGIDIYNNRKLFENLWNKHLEAIITEAISEYDKTKEGKLLPLNAVTDLIRSINVKAENAKKINSETIFIMAKKNNKFLFETQDNENGKWLHRNYIINH